MSTSTPCFTWCDKKSLQKGGHGHPWTPTSSYALDGIRWKHSVFVLSISVLCRAELKTIINATHLKKAPSFFIVVYLWLFLTCLIPYNLRELETQLCLLRSAQMHTLHIQRYNIFKHTREISLNIACITCDW